MAAKPSIFIQDGFCTSPIASGARWVWRLSARHPRVRLQGGSRGKIRPRTTGACLHGVDSAGGDRRSFGSAPRRCHGSADRSMSERDRPSATLRRNFSAAAVSDGVTARERTSICREWPCLSSRRAEIGWDGVPLFRTPALWLATARSLGRASLDEAPVKISGMLQGSAIRPGALMSKAPFRLWSGTDAASANGASGSVQPRRCRCQHHD